MKPEKTTKRWWPYLLVAALGYFAIMHSGPASSTGGGAHGFATTPNDPQFAAQYHLATMRCTDAWDITQGTAAETIAFVGGGGDTKHLDLVDRVVFAPGIDIINGDSDPSEPITGSGRTTFGAGAAAASTNNANDVSGVDWSARVLFIRATQNETAVPSAVANGILAAVAHKATALSIYYSSALPTDVIEYALLAARNAGIIACASTGHLGDTTGIRYPASSWHCIGVGSSTAADARLSVSSFGQASGLTGVDIMAPGENIVTLNPGFGSTTVTDTNVAPSIVAAAATLLKSIRMEYTPANFLALITGTAKDIGTPGFDQETGWGRLDIFNMLRTAQLNTVFPFANDSNAYRIDLFNGAIGDTGNAAATAAAGRQGRNGLAITGDNVFAGYDSSVNRDTGSIEFYARFDSAQPAETRYVLTQHGSTAKPKGSLDLVFTSDSRLQFSLQDSGVVTSQSQLRPGQWYHVALTYGPKGMILYVNGESEASRAVTGGPSPADTIFIGAPSAFGGARSARCQVDALRFSKTQRIIFSSALAAKIWNIPAQAINAVNVSWTALKNETTGVLVNVYADKDSSGFDGTLLASGLANDGQESVSLGALGSNGDPYFLYIEAYDSSFPSERALVYSDTPFRAFSPIANLLTFTPPKSDNFCVIASWNIPSILPWLRALRDMLLSSAAGRFLAQLYYGLA